MAMFYLLDFGGVFGEGCGGRGFMWPERFQAAGFMDKQAMMRLHAQAFNAHDFESLPTQYAARAAVFRDGEWLGEGPEAISRIFREEASCDDEVVERVTDLDGDAVLVTWGGREGDACPRSLVRCQMEGDMLGEVRVDHDPRVLSRAVAGPERFMRHMYTGA